MTEQKKQRAQSPFAALSFTEQQEQWRVWRAQRLDYREAGRGERPAPAETAESVPARREERPKPPAPLRQMMATRPAPPAHGNLDRVNARLQSAAVRARDYQPTSRA